MEWGCTQFEGCGGLIKNTAQLSSEYIWCACNACCDIPPDVLNNTDPTEGWSTIYSSSRFALSPFQSHLNFLSLKLAFRGYGFCSLMPVNLGLYWSEEQNRFSLTMQIICFGPSQCSYVSWVQLSPNNCCVLKESGRIRVYPIKTEKRERVDVLRWHLCRGWQGSLGAAGRHPISGNNALQGARRSTCLPHIFAPAPVTVTCALQLLPVKR